MLFSLFFTISENLEEMTKWNHNLLHVYFFILLKSSYHCGVKEWKVLTIL